MRHCSHSCKGKQQVALSSAGLSCLSTVQHRQDAVPIRNMPPLYRYASDMRRGRTQCQLAYHMPLH